MEKALRLSVIDLGFGDSGKGQFVSAIATQVATSSLCVVRFNGGAQAGHNVVLPDGRHHTFSQFGAASFLPQVHTVLASPVVIHPSALLLEAKRLREKSVYAPLSRLYISAACLVITPFIQVAGRIRERGLQHGSCGVGVGEARRLEQHAPEICLRYAQLASAQQAREIAQAQREHYAREFPSEAIFQDRCLCDAWLAQVAPLLRRVKPASEDELARLCAPRVCLFEGAQGLLLDERYGFHPHTTWSDTGPAAAQALAHAWHLGEVKHYGVLRSYLTRHGAGPFPSETPKLDVLAEPHNASTGPQGRFRRGMPDAVLLRYALRCAPEIDALLLSHADAPAKLPQGLQWCERYEDSFEPQAQDSLVKQALITEKLFQTKPVYGISEIRDAESAIAALKDYSSKPVAGVSSGPTSRDVQTRLMRW